jgi:23S rRNA pseudouridine1911/1915/1917 synthase
VTAVKVAASAASAASAAPAVPEPVAAPAMPAAGPPSAAECRCRWRADRGDAGGRLDRALVRHFAGLPDLSRSRLQGWIAAGRVRVNGTVVRRPAGRLAAGDELELELPGPPPSRRRSRPLAAQRLPLAILYEDEHLLALDKPAGLVVHPTGRHRDGTLVNALAWHLAEGREDREGREGSEAVRPGLVHRLDRDTSGVLLVAKSRAAHAGLARAIKARALRKDYLAVVYGRPPLAWGRIELKLLLDPLDRRRVAASRTEGRSAATLYELLAESCPGRADDGGRAGWLSLLRCRLVTGRTHQIRVHLAALGLPIVGDPLYGEPRHRGIADPAVAALCRDFPRQALHAWRLGLRHPVTGQALALRAPLPADLHRLLVAAGLVSQAVEAEADRLAADDALAALAPGAPGAGGSRR